MTLPVICLQEPPLSNADLSWFTAGLYLKSEHGKCPAGSVLGSPFEVIEAAPSLFTTSAELYGLTQASTLARGKTDNIDTNNRYVSGVVSWFWNTAEAM